MHSPTGLAFLLVAALVAGVVGLSTPTAIQPDPTYLTGTKTLITANMSSTSPTVYGVTYPWTMSTLSLNASLGIMGVNFYMKGAQFGWRMNILSLSDSALALQVSIKNNASPIYYLRICYIVNYSSFFDMNYVSYSLSPADNISSYASAKATCYSYDCRAYRISQLYRTKTNGKVRTFLAGFEVNSQGLPQTPTSIFGITLEPTSTPGTINFFIQIQVYGGAELDFVSYYYIAYEPAVVNVINYRNLMEGRSSIGCAYSGSTCNPTPPTTLWPTSNTTLLTPTMVVSTYNENMFFIGIDRMMLTNAGDLTTMGEFNITNIVIKNDSTIRVSFAFSGNTGKDFHVAFSYLSLQTFYCPTSGADIYYVYNVSACDNNCNGSIQQYANATNYCLPCDVLCWRCVSSPTFCLACNVTHNRIVVNNMCVCDVASGFYDDGTSTICPMCDISCKTCSGASAANCLTCDPTTFRIQVGNTCPCKTGYFNSGAATCNPCHYSCSSTSCTSAAATSCSSCNAAMKRQIQTNFSCTCMTGYYDNSTSSQLCATCRYSCQTCWAINTYCTGCDPTMKRLLNLTDNTCYCQPGFYDPGAALCLGCHATCATCNGPLSSNCLSCNSILLRSLSLTTCFCFVKYYDDAGICQPCHYSCATCSGPTASQCLTCNAAAFRLRNVTSGECYCSAGRVDVGFQACQLCDPSCLTCTFTQSSCTSCHSNPGRFQAGTSCLCGSGYVDVAFNGFCALCHYSCSTCSGTTTFCTACVSGRTLASGVCSCNAGTYDSGVATCQPCASTCATCVSGLATGCFTCPVTSLRTVSSGICLCQGTLYDAGILTCQSCSSKCLGCSGTSTNCTSCVSTDHRTLSAANTCDCQTGYLDTGSAMCMICTSPCVSCSVLPNNCTSCPADRYLLASGVCLCNNGTFQNSLGSCQACHVSCATCTSTSTTCLTCIVGGGRYKAGTSCLCLSGYYQVGLAACAACSCTCLECSAAGCISCSSSANRWAALPLCPCLGGYYDSGNSMCLKCSQTCLNCSSFSQCTVCDAALFRQWNSGAMSCPCMSGYYQAGVASCQVCHYSCSSCVGGLSTSCSSCSINRSITPLGSCPCSLGYYQAGTTCVPCALSCLGCSVSSTNCTACHTGSILSNNQCVCSTGFFANGNLCYPCAAQCLTCSISASNCLSCPSAHGTQINGTSCLCPTGKYQISSATVCLSCSPTCLTCSSLGCLTCPASSFRTYNPTLYSCPCLSGYYQTGTAICGSCSFPCVTCWNSSILACGSCATGYQLMGSSCIAAVSCSGTYYYEGVCLTKCPNSTYAGPNICLPCPTGCKTCISSLLCSSCLFGLVLSASSCIFACPSGTYSNATFCLSCPTFCLTCSLRSKSIICSSCASGYYEQDGQCSSCLVAGGTHVLQGQRCVPCLDGCKTCTDLTSSGCLTCSPNYYLHMGSCLTSCPLGYQSKDSACVPCSPGCSLCHSNKCQSCNSGFYLWNANCQQIKTYLQKGQSHPCHPNCLTCTNSSFSSCIACAQNRGDSSMMAKSGYCDCWKGSLDVGDGTCDRSTYQTVAVGNQIVASATSAVNYLQAATSAIALNGFPLLLTINYQQTYSNFYYLNSSAVMQTDSLLELYGSTSPGRSSRESGTAFGRRLESVQGDESLFMRGESWQYLSDWSLSTVCIILGFWSIAILSGCISSRLNEGSIKTILQTLQGWLRENGIILIHFLTINEVVFYGIANMKILWSSDGLHINGLKLAFSIFILLYYFAYLIRLFIASIVYSEDHKAKCSLLVACFQSDNITKKSYRIYLPIIMLRSVLMSACIVLCSQWPMLQTLLPLGIFVASCIYSFFCCPFPFHLRVFLRICQLVLCLQLLLLSVTVLKPESSRVGPAIGLMVLNFLQIACLSCMAVSMLLHKIYRIKCLHKDNRIKPESTISKQQSSVLEETVEDFHCESDFPNPKKQEGSVISKELNQSITVAESVTIQTLEEDSIPTHINRKPQKRAEINMGSTLTAIRKYKMRQAQQ